MNSNQDYIRMNAQVSTAAMMIGIDVAANAQAINARCEKLGIGQLEFLFQVAKWAWLSCLAGKAASASPDCADGFPGVWAYEVDEPYGKAMLARWLEGDSLEPGFANEILGKIVAGFLTRDGRSRGAALNAVRRMLDDDPVGRNKGPNGRRTVGM